VFNLLKHDMDIVRKHAISAIHRFYQMDKGTLIGNVDKIRRALCDKEPSVMGATLPLFLAMIQDDVMQFKDLVPSFVSILKQITEHRLPRDFDYHRIPSPWIQMNLLRILALLGRGDQAASEGMYEVLVDAMKRADTGINVGYAIVYECVKTITTIYPNTMLMDAAATSISRFIRSDSHNLKYVGIRGLAAIVKDHPKYAADHQMAVIDCLEDPDETLKRKTVSYIVPFTI
jgi:AP-4 complex subunit epsilon-1